MIQSIRQASLVFLCPNLVETQGKAKLKKKKKKKKKKTVHLLEIIHYRKSFFPKNLVEMKCQEQRKDKKKCHVLTEIADVITLRVIDTPYRFRTIFNKTDNFCDFLFSFLHTEPFLKWDQL